MSRRTLRAGRALCGSRPSRPRLVRAGIAALAVGLALAGPAVGAGLTGFERRVDEIEALVLAADFQKALARGEATRPRGRDLPRSQDVLKERARLEVLLCSAEIALGNREAARRSMKKAVFLWPLLSLDERTTSPRVVKLFESVRGGAPARRSR